MTTNVKNNKIDKIDKIIEVKPKDKGTTYSQLCKLANRLTWLFYGNNFSDYKSTFQKFYAKKYRSTRIEITYPNFKLDDKYIYSEAYNENFRKKHGVSAHKFKKMFREITSIIKLAKSHKVDIVTYQRCNVDIVS